MRVLRTSGQVGITHVDHFWAEPKDRGNPDDVAASDRWMQSKLGWFANPIFGDGDYPAAWKAQLEKKAKELGLETSPLPRFTPAQIESNRGWYPVDTKMSQSQSLIDTPS